MSDNERHAPGALGKRKSTPSTMSCQVAYKFEEWHDDRDAQPFSKVARMWNYSFVWKGPRPFGLSWEITLQEYLEDPVCHLSGLNYKVNAMIGYGKRDVKPLLSVVDTGAGPSLIRQDCCPQSALDAMDTRTDLVNLRSATNHALDVMGLVHLVVKIGDQYSRTPFIVVGKLGGRCPPRLHVHRLSRECH